jgi:hypothetical protein
MQEKVSGVAVLRNWLCFTAEFLWWLIWMSWLAPYYDMGPAVVQIRG